MKLPTYQEELLKNISSVQRRRLYRSDLKEQAKVVSRYQMFLEEDSGAFPKWTETIQAAIKSAQKKILEIEQKLVPENNVERRRTK